MDITPENIKPFFKGTKKHKNYWQTVDSYFHMSFHFDGYFIKPEINGLQMEVKVFDANEPAFINPYFSRLIDARRPSESELIQSYRRVIYLPETMSPCFKVFNSLRKIVKSPDWLIDYKNVYLPPNVAEEEQLEDYCEENYPKYKSIEGWFFEFGMRQMLTDANGLVIVLPTNWDKQDNDYYTPVATIINCKNVYGFKENEYAIYDVNRDYEYQTQNGLRKGKCLGIITKQGYWECRQVVDKEQNSGFELVKIGSFDFTKMPAWIVGSVVKEQKDDYTLYDSFLAPMLAGLDGMATAISDEDAEWVQHVYSTMWYYSSQDCNACQGHGKVQKKGGQTVTCTVCKGQGNAPKSPYRDMVIKAGSFDQNAVPSPPAGYIQKQTDIAKLFMERVELKEYRALSAINHEFLQDVPLNQSGKAKEVDRQELQNYTYSVAYHSIERVLKPIYYFVNEFRYSFLVKDVEKRKEMLPKIPVPVQFDLLTASVLEQQLKTATEAKADPEIIDQLELEYIAKNFPNETELRERFILKKNLDPLPRLTVDEKASLQLSGLADKRDIVLSNYLTSFIEQALFENEDFCELPFDKQKEYVYKLTDEKMKSLDAAEKLKNQAKTKVVDNLY